jgi:hypothetical protein
MEKTINEYPGKATKDIAEAFSFSNQQAKFKFSTSQNPQVGNDLANRIQERKVTSIPIS